jgi:hypothetical protein
VTKVKQRRSGSGRAPSHGGAKSVKAAKPGVRGRSKKPSGKPAKKIGRRPTANATRRGGRAPDPPPRVVKVRALDPQAKCGASTTVQHLFRVDETVNGTSATHLVFFDKHGWYCEHGRGCPAVDDVRRANKNLDWTRKVG